MTNIQMVELQNTYRSCSYDITLPACVHIGNTSHVCCIRAHLHYVITVLGDTTPSWPLAHNCKTSFNFSSAIWKYLVKVVGNFANARVLYQSHSINGYYEKLYHQRQINVWRRNKIQVKITAKIFELRKYQGCYQTIFRLDVCRTATLIFRDDSLKVDRFVFATLYQRPYYFSVIIFKKKFRTIYSQQRQRQTDDSLQCNRSLLNMAR